jgi:hypothetical protein
MGWIENEKVHVLNVYSRASGTTLESCGNFRKWALVERSRPLGA